ncbi:MAG TPA: adenylate/guanylate cyclase domain-containing protein [Thermoleophilaceae bacterium]
MADETGKDGRWKKLAARARELEQSPALVKAARRLREALPGDAEFGDPLSTAGSEQPQVVGRRLSVLTEQRPGLLRETGLSALQVWSSISEKQGRGRGREKLTIVFTDLAAFSEWVLKAGDDEAVRLLRDVDCAMEPAMREQGGEVVKRMGDGMMAVFSEPKKALDALLDARERLADVKADGYDPRFRAGIHVGKPRKLGGDYFGVDVNVAARLAEQASPDEVLVSDAALSELDVDSLKVKKKRRFKVKGVPDDLQAYSISGR